MFHKAEVLFVDHLSWLAHYGSLLPSLMPPLTFTFSWAVVDNFISSGCVSAKTRLSLTLPDRKNVGQTEKNYHTHKKKKSL